MTCSNKCILVNSDFLVECEWVVILFGEEVMRMYASSGRKGFDLGLVLAQVPVFIFL